LSNKLDKRQGTAAFDARLGSEPPF